jgi:hypothetical protein
LYIIGESIYKFVSFMNFEEENSNDSINECRENLHALHSIARRFKVYTLNYTLHTYMRQLIDVLQFNKGV